MRSRDADGVLTGAWKAWSVAATARRHEGETILNVSVVRPGDLDAAEQAYWRKFLGSSSAFDSPFLALEYAQALDAVRDHLRVAVASDGGQVVGFLPFEARGRGRVGPAGGGLSDVTGIVHNTDWTPDVGALLRGRFHTFDFVNLLGHQVPAGARYVVHSPSPVIDFPDGYESYLTGRKRVLKQLIQSTLRKRRKLEREIGPLRFTFAGDDPADLEALMRWKSGQYRAMGEWDRFADPRVVELLRRLHRTRSEHCSGSLAVLWAGDQRAAVHFGVRSQRTLSWWFPAYNPELGRYSPGMQLLLYLVEAAAEQGLCRIDLGAGEHGYYKDAMKTGDLSVARGTIDDGSPGARLLRAARAPRYHLRPLVADGSRLHALSRRLRRPDSLRFRD